jgi:hypothetical protein
VNPWFNIIRPDDWLPESKEAAALPSKLTHEETWADAMQEHRKSWKREAFLRYVLQHLEKKGSFASTDPVVQHAFAKLEALGWVRRDPAELAWDLVRTEADLLKPMKRAQRAHLTEEGSLQLRAYPSTIGKRFLEFTGEDEAEFEAKLRDSRAKADKQAGEDRDRVDLERLRADEETRRLRKLFGV